MWSSLRYVFLPARSAEQDPDFRALLSRLAQKGIPVGGVLGIAAVLLFVGIYVLIRGKSVSWGYEQHVALWDKCVLVGLSISALAVGRHLKLREARIFAAVLAVAASVASVSDDIAGGDTSFSPGYVTFIYLLAVLAVPYRPLQTLGLGAVLALTLYLTIELVPAWFDLAPNVQVLGHYVYLTIITVLLAGISGLLYSVRYGQYRARREAERLREQVQALEAAKSRFFVNLSHDFRTPLTLLLGPVDDALAGRYGALPKLLLRRLPDMRAQAHQLNDLIDQLLDLSKLESGAMPLRAREHDGGRFVQGQASIFRPAAERKGIDLLVELPEQTLPVWFDGEKMERVLANLLSNAFKHTPEGGTIRVRLERQHDGADAQAVLSVRDTGEGVAPEMLETVFDRFAGAGHMRDGQASTGIGLALVREIVERHGGTVEAASEPGFGAEFTVRLPLGRGHLAPEDVAETDEPERVPGAWEPGLADQQNGQGGVLEGEAQERPQDAPLVLVAEDDAAVRAYLCDLLASRYRVMEAADGQEALDRAREHRPALLISDVMMPGLSGYDVCRQVKRDEHLAPMPVVLLTARAEEEARLEGLKTGADAYLAKPLSSEELLVVAENLIEVRRLLRERVKVPDWMATKAPAVPSHEAEFLDRVQQVVAAHIGDSSFGVEWLASEVGLSARQLQRRLKALTQLTAAGFIKAMRFEHAARLLAESDLQVQEVAHAVGYEDASYFSRLFRQAYGVPPSEYMKEAT